MKKKKAERGDEVRDEVGFVSNGNGYEGLGLVNGYIT